MDKDNYNTSFWLKFYNWFSATESYWYFPKGRSIRSDDIRLAFRILSEFEGQLWGESQEEFLKKLEINKLFTRRAKNQSKADKNAMARVWKVVFSCLGLAWVEDTEEVIITEAGRRLIGSNRPEEIIEKQIQKYQVANPSLKSNSLKNLKIIPHMFLLELLLNVNFYITSDEYILFVSRSQSSDDLDKIVDFILKWRKLDPDRQALIYQQAQLCHSNLGGRRTNLLNTIKLNSSYAFAFLSACSYLEQGSKDFAIRLLPSKKFQVEDLVKHYKNNNYYIDFKNTKDWFFYFGNPDKISSKEEAIDYYINSSQTDKLKQFRDAKEIESIQIKEKILEDYLENNINALEKDLILIKRQYSTITGPIDILCKDKNDNYVVVELKKGRASDRVIGQITRYIGFIKTHMLERPDQKVRGIIVVREIDKKLEMSVSGLTGLDIKLKTFDANIYINNH